VVVQSGQLWGSFCQLKAWWRSPAKQRWLVRRLPLSPMALLTRFSEKTIDEDKVINGVGLAGLLIILLVTNRENLMTRSKHPKKVKYSSL
jgi:hypothetical protein